MSKDTVRECIDFWIKQYNPKVRRFTPHDLRSTMKSHMRALGVPRDISEMCLNHKLGGVEGIYDQHTYYGERRTALLTWLNFLEACESNEPTGRTTNAAADAAIGDGGLLIRRSSV